MEKFNNAVITGTGSYIPPIEVPNNDFAHHIFYNPDFSRIDTNSTEIVKKFESITGIKERRYVEDNLQASDIGTIACQKAIEDSGIDPETLDYIIAAHNFGDVIVDSFQTDILPSLAARIKHNLKIQNPKCVAYDILFGCPGWLQGVIQANTYIKAGEANRILVVGTETLSRILDPHDRDSMIFSDGAGACVIESRPSETKKGILASSALTHSLDEAYYLSMRRSNKEDLNPKIRYIKMQGRKVYEYALTHVPEAMKECVEKAGIDIHQVRKVFIHQANEKMDEAIIKRLFKLYEVTDLPENIMPMSIDKLGNSSVATVPTLFDLVRKGKLKFHELHEGDIIILASVGAGMHVNAVIYKY